MNKDMRLLFVAMLVVAVISVAAFSLLSNYTNNNAGDDSPDDDKEEETTWPITVKDPNGHQVTINETVKRVAVTDLSTLEVFATAYGDGWEDLVCAMPSDISSKDPSLGNYISKTWPQLSSLPKIPALDSALSSDPIAVAESIVDSKPDLVILPKYVTDGFKDSLDGFYAKLDQAGVPYFNMMFYTAGLAGDVFDENIGQICKLLEKEQRGSDIGFFYDFTYAVVKSRLLDKTDTIRFYVEVPTTTPSSYGNVTAYGFPEIDILGYNIQKDYGGGNNYDFNLDKMKECDVDWIVLVGTPYYEDEQLLGYFVEKDEVGLSAYMAQFLARDGWSDLDAVKNKHVCLRYGELRYGIAGIYDLCQFANAIDKELISDDELQTVIKNLKDYLPWGFEGTFTYMMA